MTLTCVINRVIIIIIIIIIIRTDRQTDRQTDAVHCVMQPHTERVAHSDQTANGPINIVVVIISYSIQVQLLRWKHPDAVNTYDKSEVAYWFSLGTEIGDLV